MSGRHGVQSTARRESSAGVADRACSTGSPGEALAHRRVARGQAQRLGNARQLRTGQLAKIARNVRRVDLAVAGRCPQQRLTDTIFLNVGRWQLHHSTPFESGRNLATMTQRHGCFKVLRSIVRLARPSGLAFRHDLTATTQTVGQPLLIVSEFPSAFRLTLANAVFRLELGPDQMEADDRNPGTSDHDKRGCGQLHDYLRVLNRSFPRDTGTVSLTSTVVVSVTRPRSVFSKL